jgi:hypothetical protein
MPNCLVLVVWHGKMRQQLHACSLGQDMCDQAPMCWCRRALMRSLKHSTAVWAHLLAQLREGTSSRLWDLVLAACMSAAWSGRVHATQLA